MQKRLYIYLILFVLMMNGCVAQQNVSSKPTPVISTTPRKLPTIQQPTLISTSTIHPTETVQPNSTSTKIPPTVTFTDNFQTGVSSLLIDQDQSIIYINSLDQKIPQPLLSTNDDHLIPSPDGSKIALLDKREIVTVDLLSGSRRSIPQPPHGVFGEIWNGAWSPDGNFIAYAIQTVTINGDTAIVDKYPNIYIADLAQGKYIQLTTWDTTEFSPKWSPDGKYLAFLSDKAKQNNSELKAAGPDLYLMNTLCLKNIETCKSAFLKQLTNTGESGDINTFSWSPDSKNIAFTKNQAESSYHDIFIVNLDGTVSNLTNSPDKDEDAFDWSPEGKFLAIRDSTHLASYIYLFDINTKSLKRVTNSPEKTEGKPYWSPDGKLIIFRDEENSQILAFIPSTGQTIQYTPQNQNLKFVSWVTIFPEFKPGLELSISPLGDNLNLHAEPSLNSKVEEVLHNGDKIKIIDGPIISEGLIWWKIETKTVNGWVIQIPSWFLPIPDKKTS